MARYTLCFLDDMSRVTTRRELDCAGDAEALHRATLIGGESRWELWRDGARVNSPRPGPNEPPAFPEAPNG